MRRIALLPALALFLVGADGPEDAPAEDVPAEDVPTDDASATDAPEDAAAEVAAPDAPTGADVLAEATSLLRARDWTGALDIAIPAIATYPDLAASFQAIAQLATDQIARGPSFQPPGSSSTTEQPLAVPGPGGQPTNPNSGSSDPYYGWRSPRWDDSRPHPAADDPREGILIGFDAGLTNGVRVEWKAKGRTVDGVGLQAGLGTWVYGGLYLAPITQVYMDFQSRSDFQFETSLGILWYSGSAYPLVGIGAQWDPPKPIQITAGVDVGLGVFPDVSVGFLW